MYMGDDLKDKVFELRNNSPLIKWLIEKIPLLIKSFTLAIIISYIVNKYTKMENSIIKISAPIFLALTIISSYAPKILKSVEYGTGFAMASSLLNFIDF